MRLHEDWPEYDLVEKWGADTPADDLDYALRESSVSITDVARVDLYWVSYHGVRWSFGSETGSELEMYVLAELSDGRWVVVEAGNDYTGWGCQDYSDVRVAASRDEALAEMTDAARYALGLKEIG